MTKPRKPGDALDQTFESLRRAEQTELEASGPSFVRGVMRRIEAANIARAITHSKPEQH